MLSQLLLECRTLIARSEYLQRQSADLREQLDAAEPYYQLMFKKNAVVSRNAMLITKRFEADWLELNT